MPSRSCDDQISGDKVIKVIDIFAGPGGLGEGFSSVMNDDNEPVFDVRLSIEKEETAHKTLTLRKFFRQFPNGKAPKEYYQFLRGEIEYSELFEKYPKQAEEAGSQAWCAKLGQEGENPDVVRERIKTALGKDDNWVLIGGPPCQAYSLAGRSRNSGNPDYDPSKDERQRLYVEYLQILAEHRPAVFVMENVKGLLSATLANEKVFERILADLRNPAMAITREGRGNKHVQKGEYRVYSLTAGKELRNGDISGALIKAEEYGIPQARHRVILLGVRDDLSSKPKPLKKSDAVSLNDVIDGLPRLRSGISPQKKDGSEEWLSALSGQLGSRWANAGANRADGEELVALISKNLGRISVPRAGRGGEFLPRDVKIAYRPDWYLDSRIGGVCNHSARGHMQKDLYRYFYAACYAQVHERTPTLKDFPTDLLPEHGNINAALQRGHFSDRFRVQVAKRPSTTIVSHISKDGHYYIHYDPLQCRSLTVREAARAQTFPDNYYFCGNRTSQYVQVGNAVPPMLAHQIGEIVWELMRRAGIK